MVFITYWQKQTYIHVIIRKEMDTLLSVMACSQADWKLFIFKVQLTLVTQVKVSTTKVKVKTVKSV